MTQRINPHQLHKGFIGPNGIKRIARTGTSFVGEIQFHPLEKKPILIAEPAGYVMVVLHAKEGKLSTLDREVLYVARVLAGRESHMAVLATVFGRLEEDMTRHGVDRELILDDMLPADKLVCTEKLRRKYEPQHILFGEGDAGDSDLARRLAVTASLSIATGVIEIDDKRLRRICDNGLRQGIRDLTDIIVLTSGVAAADIDFITEAKKEEWGEKRETNSSSYRDYSLAANDIPLTEANFILSAGNGVANMETFFRLANKLGATVGGSQSSRR